MNDFMEFRCGLREADKAIRSFGDTHPTSWERTGSSFEFQGRSRPVFQDKYSLDYFVSTRLADGHMLAWRVIRTQ